MDAWAWLETRAADIPEPLRERMRQAVAAVTATGEPAADLGEAALDCLRDALERGDDRAAALPLLAADALLTHAAEAAALAGPESLRAVLAKFDGPSLGRLMAGEPAA